MEKKKKYIAPKSEVLNARVERGFLLSSNNTESLEEGQTIDPNDFIYN